ncbi:MAG TPA: GNAT family protein [Streptosporangiaceae bacterium]
MFASERVRLRPMVPDDATVLYEMWSDPEDHLITDDSPMLAESLAARRARLEKSLAEPDVSTARFTAETITDGTVIGTCSLWGLDAFNQFGHLGISLLPAARTQGYGREMVRLLCHYGFRFRNLHRIELETLAANAAMRKLAESCGFVLEGIQREQAYDGDGFSDIVLYGLLRQEWSR